MEKIGQCEEKLKSNIISEEFNNRESRYYDVSVKIDHHQDLEKMLSSVISSPINV